ncbi:hypothetical protein [Actinomadura miaoliensis]|uniref:Transposase n=1 Tax=Actinomadura miaoliensis TaxID=430685 RepID=A0ABP7UXC2_9ACTN
MVTALAAELTGLSERIRRVDDAVFEGAQTPVAERMAAGCEPLRALAFLSWTWVDCAEWALAGQYDALLAWLRGLRSPGVLTVVRRRRVGADTNALHRASDVLVGAAAIGFLRVAGRSGAPVCLSCGGDGAKRLGRPLPHATSDPRNPPLLRDRRPWPCGRFHDAVHQALPLLPDAGTDERGWLIDLAHDLGIQVRDAGSPRLGIAAVERPERSISSGRITPEQALPLADRRACRRRGWR